MPMTKHSAGIVQYFEIVPGVLEKTVEHKNTERNKTTSISSLYPQSLSSESQMTTKFVAQMFPNLIICCNVVTLYDNLKYSRWRV